MVQQDTRPWDSLEVRYFLYRIEGVEPEGLDAIVRKMDRIELATTLIFLHEDYSFLEPFDRHWWTGCTLYDPIATELLERAQEPEETDDCLPAGR